MSDVPQAGNYYTRRVASRQATAERNAARRRDYHEPLEALRPDWVTAWHRLNTAVDAVLEKRYVPEPDPADLHQLAAEVTAGIFEVGEVLNQADALRDRVGLPTTAAKLAQTESADTDETLNVSRARLANAANALKAAVAGIPPDPILCELGIEEVAFTSRWARTLVGLLDPFGDGPSGDDMAFGLDHFPADYARAAWLCGCGPAPDSPGLVCLPLSDSGINVGRTSDAVTPPTTAPSATFPVVQPSTPSPALSVAGGAGPIPASSSLAATPKRDRCAAAMLILMQDPTISVAELARQIGLNRRADIHQAADFEVLREMIRGFVADGSRSGKPRGGKPSRGYRTAGGGVEAIAPAEPDR